MTKQDMVKLLLGDLTNEMRHMMFYLRNAATLRGLHRQEIRELFLEEAASEMKHVQEFQDMLVGLGVNLTDPQYSLDLSLLNNIKIFTDPASAVFYAKEMEDEVVANYSERIQQAALLGGVDGHFIEIFLEEQLLHSRQDADNFRQLAM
jgi:ferritin-like protein